MGIAINTTSLLAASAGTTPPGAGPTGAGSQTPQPALHQPCRCAQAARDGYGTLAGLARTARSDADALAGAVRLCAGLDWTGAAANLCRERLDEIGRAAAALADQAEGTARIAAMAGGAA